eukprot:TRINITY_DN460_c0_g1_i14.p2 TRINITY_DN460_c0_g1~~TRINITY_DN460_c0_g1_i14.p2  ORF type:complete len:100 (-),score=20.57 TRINITY_DN460_c0_g1_i14:619-918(-)
MDSDGYFERANTHYTRGSYEEAIEDYTKSIELDGGDAITYTHRGDARVYARLGRHEEAVSDYTYYFELGSREAIAFRNRADVCHTIGQYEKATCDRERA